MSWKVIAAIWARIAATYAVCLVIQILALMVILHK